MVGTASHTLERIFVTTDEERGESGAAETQEGEEEEEEDSSIICNYLLEKKINVYIKRRNHLVVTITSLNLLIKKQTVENVAYWNVGIQ
jgi:hypothetical protein